MFMQQLPGEEILTRIFEKVLEVARIDPEATFVDLGGDSLAAMLIISRVRSEFGVELSIEDFFLYETSIHDLAIRISELKESANEGLLEQ
jgi:acyl carrier protein